MKQEMLLKEKKASKNKQLDIFTRNEVSKITEKYQFRAILKYLELNQKPKTKMSKKRSDSGLYAGVSDSKPNIAKKCSC